MNSSCAPGFLLDDASGRPSHTSRYLGRTIWERNKAVSWLYRLLGDGRLTELDAHRASPAAWPASPHLSYLLTLPHLRKLAWRVFPNPWDSHSLSIFVKYSATVLREAHFPADSALATVTLHFDPRRAHITQMTRGSFLKQLLRNNVVFQEFFADKSPVHLQLIVPNSSSRSYDAEWWTLWAQLNLGSQHVRVELDGICEHASSQLSRLLSGLIAGRFRGLWKREAAEGPVSRRVSQRFSSCPHGDELYWKGGASFQLSDLGY